MAKPFAEGGPSFHRFDAWRIALRKKKITDPRTCQISRASSSPIGSDNELYPADMK
jgi:hypothetical protein